MNASIANVRGGTATTFEHLASNFKFRVVGDGKVEPELSERFQSVGFVEDVSDRRLRTFVAAHHQLREAKLPYEQSLKATEESLLATLGAGWKVDALYAPGANQKGNGVSRVQLKLEEAGAGTQVLNLQHYEGSEFQLTTTCQMAGWQVDHGIQGKLDQGKIQPDSLQERAYFSSAH